MLRTVSTAFCLALAATFAMSPAHAQVKLRYAHVGVAGAPQTRFADEMAALVKERSNGRVEIQVFANSQLGGVGEMVDGIKSGAIAMGHHDFASLGKILPLTAVFNTPFVYKDAAHAMRATDPRSSAVLQDVNKQLIDAGGMRIIGSTYQGARQLTSKEKVLSPDDMKGKKYRGVPIKLWSSMLTGMGAVATPVEVSELATALATGLVIGQENPLANIWTLKLFEVQKYVMMTSHMQSVLSVFVNERVWQGIPEADRKIIEDAVAEVGQRSLKWDADSVAQYRKDLEGKGMVFVEDKDGLNIDAFRKAVLAQVGKDFADWTPYIEKIQAVK